MEAKRTKLTDDQIRGMKPAVYTGLRYNKTTGKIQFICWPGVRFPKHRGIVVLKRRQFRSAEAAKAWATEEIARRLARWFKKRKAVR